ncbi:hypothetical protein [Pseudaestuariivita rosea]|uniref:hypothetical protein n=1 Tax=Pseudaestuariivita rosea TaxID=2763263 RepID=UPI001ABA467E|nr:hypothetical protein [Pseudaestuariivita rosea]
MRRFVICAAACLCPLGLAAECVTGDMVNDKGIIARFDDGAVETHVRHDDQMIAVITEGDGTWRTMLAKGIYLIEVIDVINGNPDPSSRFLVNFDTAVQDLPLPTDQETFEVVATSSYPGDVPVSETHNYSFGPAETLQVGDCSYQSIPITMRYMSDVESSIEIVDYLPELGTSFLRFEQYDDQERYTYRLLSLTAAR